MRGNERKCECVQNGLPRLFSGYVGHGVLFAPKTALWPLRGDSRVPAPRPPGSHGQRLQSVTVLTLLCHAGRGTRQRRTQPGGGPQTSIVPVRRVLGVVRPRLPHPVAKYV